MTRICGVEFGTDYIRYVILNTDGSLLCHSGRNDPEGKFPFGSAVWLAQRHEESPLRLAATGLGAWPEKPLILQLPNQPVPLANALSRGKAAADYSLAEPELYAAALGAALLVRDKEG